MAEERSEQRLMCADLVDVRWKDKSGRSRRVVANLEDISESGVCLQVDVQIPVCAVVRITYPSGEYTGVVRYCQSKDFAHFVGVEFETGRRWSRAEFVPSTSWTQRKWRSVWPESREAWGVVGSAGTERRGWYPHPMMAPTPWPHPAPISR